MTSSADEILCPVCESDHVLPARPRVLDHLVRLVGARPYWCEDCGERFRSTALVEGSAANANPSRQMEQAVCPNCGCGTTIHLTPDERQMAVSDGWVVSCPDCRALFAYVKPSTSSAIS